MRVMTLKFKLKCLVMALCLSGCGSEHNEVHMNPMADVHDPNAESDLSNVETENQISSDAQLFEDLTLTRATSEEVRESDQVEEQFVPQEKNELSERDLIFTEDGLM